MNEYVIASIRAAKIEQIFHGENGTCLVFDRGNVKSTCVSKEYVERFKPHVGAYYVQFKNGNESLVEADAFEAGYMLKE